MPQRLAKLDVYTRKEGGKIRGTAGDRAVDIGGRDFRMKPDTGEFEPASGLTQQGRVEVPGLHERVVARTPAGRWGVPDDLAGTAVYLSSRASDFVTGAAIPVDGGYSSQA